MLILTLGFSHNILGELTIQNDSSKILKIKIIRFENNLPDINEYKYTEEFTLPINEKIRIKQFKGLNTFPNMGFDNIIKFTIYNENNEEIISYDDGYIIYQLSIKSGVSGGGCFSKIRTEYYTFIITDEVLK